MSSPGATGLPLVVQVEDLQGGGSTEHVFRKSPVRVGRNALNELTLSAPFVSLSHAVLRYDADRTEVIDLGSTNGVLVDGRRIEPNVPVPVTAASDVRIGALRLHFGRLATTAQPAVREETQFRRATAQIRLTPGHGIRLPPDLGVSAPQKGGFALASPAPAPSTAPKKPLLATSTEAPKVEVLKLGGVAGQGAPEAPAAPVEQSVEALHPLYAEYRQAWERVHEAMLAKAADLPAEDRARFGSLLEAQMPALEQEEQFRAFTGRPAPQKASEAQAARTPGGVSASPEQRSLLQVFARTYAGGAELSSDADFERLLERISEVLEAFGTAFLELRKGQAEFGEGIAVRTVTADTPLRRARSAQELLRLLLDASADGATRIDDLTGGFGEVMIHQVAMLGATRRGIRAMLDRLDPRKLEGEAPFPARLWQRWQRFESAWNALAEEEHAVQVVFGPEFARSYAMVMGGHGTGGGSGSGARGSGKTAKPKGGAR